MEKSKKHKYYDVILAWANGEKVQCKYNGKLNEYCAYAWIDYDISNCPSFDTQYEWRIKPKTQLRRYRMALTKVFGESKVRAIDITDSCIDDPAEYNVEGFICWIGATAEVEINCD